MLDGYSSSSRRAGSSSSSSTAAVSAAVSERARVVAAEERARMVIIASADAPGNAGNAALWAQVQYADVCGRMQYAHVCSRMLTSADAPGNALAMQRCGRRWMRCDATIYVSLLVLVVYMCPY